MQHVELNVIPRDDDLTQVALAGRLDALAVDQIGKRFQGATAARGKPTIIDMTEVAFIASLGLGMLLTAARALHHRGARAVIVSPQPLVMRVMEAAQMTSVIPVMTSVPEAVEFLNTVGGSL